MKYFVFSVFIFAFSACNLFNRESAIEYNNRIIDIQTRMNEQMTAFGNTFASSDSSEMYKSLDALNKTLDSGIMVVIKLKGFDGSTELKDAGLRLFKFYKKTAEKEYPELIDLLTKEDFTEADESRIDEINEIIAKEEKPLDDAMEVAQNNMATKYNFKLNKTEKKMEEK